MGCYMSKLKAVQVRNFKPKSKPYTVADGGGLSAHVAPTGAVSWRYRYRFEKKATTLVLGHYPEMSLGEAREEHLKAKKLLASGINPTAQRKQKVLDREEEARIREDYLLTTVAMEWIEARRESWSEGYRKAVMRSLKKDVFPDLGNMRVDEITTPDVLAVARKVEDRGSYEIAGKVLQRINAICCYAIQVGKAKDNPAAAMKGVLKTRKVEHRPAMSISELPDFFEKLHHSNEHVVTKSALLFTILTAARSGEVRFAVWDEIYKEDREWRIPGERMKMGTPHIVPLSDQAMAIIEAMKPHSIGGYIFPGIKSPQKPLSENTMLYAMYRLGYHSRATVHGFRAVFSTAANESGLFDKDAIERQLAHQERNRVRAAYHRSEYLGERRKMMQWWSDKLEGMQRGK